LAVFLSLERLFTKQNLKSEDVEQAKVNENLVGVTFEVVTNNGSDEASIRLVDLKNIFSRQLPKMPKEYIVRLVFDHRHISVAMIRNGRTIGGICYRPYPEQRFGEIAFCAISGNEQLKGYGSILMNQLKRHVQKDSKCNP
jgi:histone acetyltransferase